LVLVVVVLLLLLLLLHTLYLFRYNLEIWSPL
jgi:hypothetical protein